jgi:hypothetical protein
MVQEHNPPAERMHQRAGWEAVPGLAEVSWTARQTTTSMMASTIGGGDIIVQPEKPAAEHSAEFTQTVI